MTKGGKHCGKWRNCTFCAISSFVNMFSKSRLLQRRQKASIWGKGLIMSEKENSTIPSNALCSKRLNNFSFSYNISPNWYVNEQFHLLSQCFQKSSAAEAWEAEASVFVKGLKSVYCISHCCLYDPWDVYIFSITPGKNKLVWSFPTYIKSATDNFRKMFENILAKKTNEKISTNESIE